MDKVFSLITPEDALHWLIIALLFGYFIYKEWPEFRKRVSGKALEEAADKSVEKRLETIESDVKEIKEKLERDYIRLNDMERWKQSMQKIAADSLEERGIIMQALLGVLGGLQEIGANGHTKDAEAKIREYLNKKAHED